uniref:glutathione gamma-glutamylcysteinyltransferase n=2 Tax=Ascaris TaxID=6251 RepID=A0A0M3I0J4_ASCLU
MEVKSSTVNFYRRPLPSSCIAFASETGKTLFKESLLAGDANIYFKLASQFLTQDEPAYCGLSTLVMVLNALDVDPHRIWKAPWRFYHESMLDCCLPLEVVKKKGITLTQFSCLASCNRLYVDLKYANSSDDFLAAFRENVQKCVRSEDSVLVVSYNRQVLGQTGIGHFSPLGAFHKDTDRVLIMDVARFKYPPHWVQLSKLRDAMLTVDRDTGKPRGYMVIKLRDHTRPLILFYLKADVDSHKTEFVQTLNEWQVFLAASKLADDKEELKLVCSTFERLFANYAACEMRGRCGDEADCCMAKEMSACCHNVCQHVRSTIFIKYITSPAVVALLLAWPLEETSDRAIALKKLIANAIKNFDSDSNNEIGLLRTQIEVISAECAECDVSK